MRPSRKPESSKRIAMSELRYLVKLMQGFYTRGVGDTSPERAARFWQFLRTNCPTFMAALDANFEGEWREIPFTSALNGHSPIPWRTRPTQRRMNMAKTAQTSVRKLFATLADIRQAGIHREWDGTTTYSFVATVTKDG